MTTPEQDASKYLKDSVAIEPIALQEEYVRLPADLAYWNSQYADALREHLIAKMECDETEARLHGEHRDRILATGGKATVSDIEAAVQTDPRLREARVRTIDTEVNKARIKGIVDAVCAKRECLISLGAHLRQEMENDPVVRRRQADAHTRPGA